jgi:simple sugar transport system substrate-binding protein
MGTSIPSMTEKYLATGAIDKIFLWDSALAGKAMLAMLEILADGGTISAGLDLGVPGYEKITVSASNPKSFEGAAWLVLDKDTASEYKI